MLRWKGTPPMFELHIHPDDRSMAAVGDSFVFCLISRRILRDLPKWPGRLRIAAKLHHLEIKKRQPCKASASKLPGGGGGVPNSVSLKNPQMHRKNPRDSASKGALAVVFK